MDHGAESGQRCLCPFAAGARGQGGRLQPHGLGAPSLPDPKHQRPQLSLEGKELEQCAKHPGPHPGGCVLTWPSAPDPRESGAQDGHKGLNSVTFIQSVTLFLLPMSGDHQGISGLMSPPKPEVKPSTPQPMESRGLGGPLPGAPGQLCQPLSFTKDE